VPRTQRSTIIRLPDTLLDREEQCFPKAFDRDAVVASFALRAVARRLNDISDASLAHLGINAAKHSYLVVLYFTSGGALSLSELSTLVSTSNATVTVVIGALERAGLVKRTVDPADRRSSIIKLTAKGRRVVESAVPLRHRDTQMAMRGLSRADRVNLGQLLLKIGANLSTMGE
jgi:DNA-binding MarR family transcriptional regulator